VRIVRHFFELLVVFWRNELKKRVFMERKRCEWKQTLEREIESEEQSINDYWEATPVILNSL
jgi:hypothetical protein